MKISRLSLRETRDKRPLGRDPDRSWCHRHTTSILPPMSMESWTATKKALSYSQCGGDTSFCQIPYSTVACPEFRVALTSYVRILCNLHTERERQKEHLAWFQQLLQKCDSPEIRYKLNVQTQYFQLSLTELMPGKVQQIIVIIIICSVILQSS